MKKFLFSALMLLIAATTLSAQEITVRGTVIGSGDEEPLIGASIVSEETKRGVAADIDGNFEIRVPEGSTLIVSYIGYVTERVAARPEMTIVLKENEELLDEVVVIGYQTVRKADLTGAVSVMDMKEPLSENSGNIMSSMAGKLPGVNVIPDAAPGGTGSIRIRGMSTANSSNDPLYIIDGVPTDNLNSINPSDIETMQVLKDAASASIYGSRAANGVVIITTKSGKGDKLSVNISYATSAQTIARSYKMLGASDWGYAYWQAAANSNVPIGDKIAALYGNGPTPVLQPYLDGNPNFPTTNTDWQKEVYRTAWTNNLTASVASNSEKASMLFSVNYINQQGNIKETFYERYSSRLNSRFNINRWVSVGENLSVAHWTNRGVDVAGDRGIPTAALLQNPAMPVYGKNGEWANPMTLLGSDLANPVRTIHDASDNSFSSWRILGNAYLELFPVKGLTLKSNIGIEHSQYFNVTRVRPVNENDIASVGSVYGQGDTWTWTNTANYHIDFLEENHLTALLGTEAIGYTFKEVSGSRQGYDIYSEEYMQVDAGTGQQNSGGTKRQWSVFSLFAKVDYNFAERYLASFTIRRDENSRFAKGHRAGVFPAFSLAWRPTMEPFFPRNEILTDLKVRYSWGQNGNANIPQLYPAYSTYIYNNGNGAYDLTGTNSLTQAGITLSASGNPELTWETTTQNNIGVDLQFLYGAINVTADYYIKNTKNMLTIPPVLAVAGQNAAIWRNTGAMRNHGWEISVAYRSPQYGDFSWNGSFNISQYKNEVKYLNNREAFIGGDIRLIPGQPMGVYYGYVCDGIFQNAEQVANHATQEGAAPGRLIYRDLNGDGVINDEDRCIIGNPNPSVSMGLNLNFKYKDFSLDAFFAGDFNYDIINHTKSLLYSMSTGPSLSSNRAADILNAWTPTNTNTDIPALSLDNNNNETRFSTYYVENGSYMKLKYLRLSYALPQKICSKFTATNLDVYFQIENVFTITKYKGLDPELLPSTYGARVDEGAYPRPRTFTIGLNLGF